MDPRHVHNVHEVHGSEAVLPLQPGPGFTQEPCNVRIPLPHDPKRRPDRSRPSSYGREEMEATDMRTSTGKASEWVVG